MPAAGGESLCPACAAPVLVALFPAYGRGLDAAGAGTAVVTEGEAGCFFHPGRQAARVCGGCGRFLCALCDVEFAGGQWCPKCLADARRAASASFPQTRLRHDYIIWAVLALTVVMFPIGVVTGPGAFLYALWAWRRPPSLVAASRARLAGAMVAAALLGLGAGVFWFTVITRS